MSNITYTLDNDMIIIHEQGRHDIEVYPETAEVILNDIMTDVWEFVDRQRYEQMRAKYQGAVDFYRSQKGLALTFR